MRFSRGRAALRLWCSLGRRLTLLHLLLLSGMLLLNLLCLLSVALFHLLFLCVVVVFCGGLLMFFFLLLLKLLVILRLLGSQLVLLLLIFLVGCSVARVWRRELMRLQIAGVIVGSGSGMSFGGSFGTIFRGGASFISWSRCIAACTIGWRSLVFASCFSGANNASFEITGFGRSRDGGLALVGGGTQFGVTASGLHVLRLRGYRTDVVLVSVRLLLRRRTRFDPTRTTVIADMSF